MREYYTNILYRVKFDLEVNVSLDNHLFQSIARKHIVIFSNSQLPFVVAFYNPHNRTLQCNYSYWG